MAADERFTDEPVTGWSRWKGAAGVTLGLLALWLVVTVAGGGDDSGGESSAGSEPIAAGKYDQTWPKSYSSTTCTEWGDEMTEHEQWVAAADMLTGARNKGDGGAGVAPDYLVDTFRGGIDTACVIDTMTLDEVGAGLYLTERARFAP